MGVPIQRRHLPLHSKMYLFLPHTWFEGLDTFFALHSKMYLFLHRSLISGAATWFFTFQNVSISTWSAWCWWHFSFLLYIPKCIYFYYTVSLISHRVNTLHSKMYLFLPAAGHFVDRQIFALHSKMYLFLRVFTFGILSSWAFFTFQNVSISTMTIFHLGFSSIIFTFQNVSISTICGVCIYRSRYSTFTFQNVSISTLLLQNKICSSASFTFQNVSISTTPPSLLEVFQQ